MLRFRLKGRKISQFYLLILLLFLGFILSPKPAAAARKKVIFQLSNFRHWTEITYDYNGKTYNNDTGPGRNSQDHELEETYHLEIDYAILDRELANGSLAVDLGLDQTYENEDDGINSNGSSAGFIGEYLFNMIAFERRFYPISLMSNLAKERVSAPFTENYDTTRQILAADISLQSSFLPTRFSYNYSTQDTSGLNIDREQKREEFSLTANSASGDFSETWLDAKSSHGRTDYSDNGKSSTRKDTDELNLRNFLQWGPLEEKNSLVSRYRFVDDTGTSELRTEQWDEDLELQLGKALFTGFSYSYRTIKSPDQDRRQKQGDAWVEHQLFDSLTTSFEYSAYHNDYLYGKERDWQYQGNISYSKDLPWESHLNLSYTHSYGENDTNFDEQQLMVTDESFFVTIFLSGFLDHLDIIPESIVVYNADRSIIYDLGTEYLINIIGRRTELQIIGGGIVAGDVLSIDYLYQVNNSLKYSTAGNSLSASLSLLGHRYQLYGNLSKIDQNLISGEADVAPLTQQTFAQIGLDGNWEQISFGTSYRYQDSTNNTDKTTEAFVNYLLRKNLSYLNLRVMERYTLTQDHDSLNGGSSDVENRNFLSFNSDYRRQLRRNLTLNLRGRVIDIRGLGDDRNDIFLGMSFELRWYKFELRLEANATWEIYDDRDSREDSVSFKIRRYF